MTELRFHKLICQVVCTEHDEDGTVVTEAVAAEGMFFPAQLTDLPRLIEEAVQGAQARRDEKAAGE